MILLMVIIMMVMVMIHYFDVNNYYVYAACYDVDAVVNYDGYDYFDGDGYDLIF